MDFWVVMKVYGIISVALAGTSYFTLYRPSIELTEEILDENLPSHRGWVGVSLWLTFAMILSPLTLYVLLSNDNEDFIEDFAVRLSEHLMDEDEEEEE